MAAFFHFLFHRLPGLIVPCYLTTMNRAEKKSDARKTPGTLAVEKHRPAMNKLTAADRQRLRQRAAVLLYGHEALAPGR